MERELHPILSEELAALQTVLERLARLEQRARAADGTVQDESGLVRELERLREMLVSREDTKDVAALSDQWHRQSSILRQLRRGRGGRRVDPGSPYFARLVLDEDGERRELYLGRATCLEEGLRIVDWRDAPISAVFYRYRQGEDYDEQIAGRQRSGRILARRMVSVREQQLERVSAPEGEFVRDPESSVGWTENPARPSRLRGSLDSAGSAQGARASAPSDSAKSDFAESASVETGSVETGSVKIGSVETGSVDMASADTGSLETRSTEPFSVAAKVASSPGLISEADKRLSEITGLIDPEQFELITRPKGFLVIRGVAGSGKTTVALHRVAYLAFDDPEIDSAETLVVMFSEALRRYVSHVLPSLGLEGVEVKSFPAWVRAQRQRHFPGLPTRIRGDTPALVARLKLDPGLAVALERHVAATAGEATWEQAVIDWATVLTQTRALRQQLGDLDGRAVSGGEIEEFVRWNARLVDPVLAFLDGDHDAADDPIELDPEDDALLLRAYQLRVGPLRAKRRRALRYRHLLVDEAQDFSPIEMQVLLGCVSTHGSISLAGDTQQHISAEGGFASWREFFAHAGIAGAEIETLRVSYRATEPVMRFAWAVLGELREEDEIPTTVRSGQPVEVFEFQDVGACVGFLGDALRELEEKEPFASTAILAPSSAVADLYHGALERIDLRGLRRIRAGEFPFAPGIEVCEVEHAKGLEFDYVILLDVSAGAYPDRPQERRKLHVAATRAVHQLWVTTAHTLSPIVKAIDVRAD